MIPVLSMEVIEPIPGLKAQSLAILLDILLLTYRLGSDLGVVYASRFITDQRARGLAELSPPE